MDRRSAGRHHQLPARPAAVRGFHRAGPQGIGDAGGGVRPGAKRPLHRLEGNRRLSQRPAHPREQAHAARGRPDRHRLPLLAHGARGRLPAHAARGDAGHRGRAPSRRRVAGSLLRGGGLLRRLLGDRPLALGYRRRHAADHRGRRAGGGFPRRTRLPEERQRRGGQSEGVRPAPPADRAPPHRETPQGVLRRPAPDTRRPRAARAQA